ncbi:MAG: hypothetical protein B0D92_08065 [Spirochaeta sp. LUC14_002_19_P3]|nr:MAG: hypothetical protein B0D92_08065 [Spirochaeta sp. LUC14_002_19_P3]
MRLAGTSLPDQKTGEDAALEIHLPHPVFDSHFHGLHIEERGMDADRLLAALFSSGLTGAVDVAVDENNFERRLQWAAIHSRLRLSAGIHPSSSAENSALSWDERLEIISNQAKHPKVAAIGESGLDFYREHAPREIQMRAFRDQLDLAAALNKPVIIHNRDADEQLLSLIRDSSCRMGVLHCFSSDWETARQALDLGYYISFAGNITYKKTENLQDAAKRIPEDRILIETDSPYLLPQPVRSRKSNHPGYIGFTLEALAAIRGKEPEHLARQTNENAMRLFS